MNYEKRDTILKLDGISLAFGERTILHDINATICDIVRPNSVTGQVVSILGPSGIGKTQLSRIVTGLLQPTAGSVTIQGKPVERGLVGFVSQNYLLFDWATIHQNMEIAGCKSGQPEAVWRDKLAVYLKAFELTQYLNYYPAKLSGGTRQRAAIVQQLLCSEHFLVMDEPFSGLDLVMKQKVCDLIVKVANLDELNTIIVVTHDVTEAVRISDTIWMLGQARQQDNGQWLRWATIVETFDLAQCGIAWGEGTAAERQEFLEHIRTRFVSLKEQ